MVSLYSDYWIHLCSPQTTLHFHHLDDDLWKLDFAAGHSVDDNGLNSMMDSPTTE